MILWMFLGAALYTAMAVAEKDFCEKGSLAALIVLIILPIAFIVAGFLFG